MDCGYKFENKAIPYLSAVRTSATLSKEPWSCSARFGGGRLAFLRSMRGNLRFARLHLHPPNQGRLFPVAEFPPSWENVATVKSLDLQFWNSSHQLIRLIIDRYEEIEELENRKIYGWDDPELARWLTEAVGSKAFAAYFLVRFSDSRSLRAIRELFPDEFSRMLAVLGLPKTVFFVAKTSSALVITFIKGTEIGTEEIFAPGRKLELEEGTILELPDEHVVVESLEKMPFPDEAEA